MKHFCLFHLPIRLSINIKINVYLKFYNTLIFTVLKVLLFGEDLGGAT